MLFDNNKKKVEEYQKERELRLKNQIGSPRLSDAPILYEDKKFNKRKKTNDGGRYDWQGKMLKDLPQKKYGRSYAAKFEKLADEAGIPENQRASFKTFLDAQERKVSTSSGYDRAKENNEKKVASKMAYSKSIEQNKVKEAELQKKKDGSWLNSWTDKDKLKARLEEENRQTDRRINSMALGLPAEIQKAFTGKSPEYKSKRKIGEGGGKDIISDAVGYLLPTAGTLKAIKSTPLAAKGVEELLKAGKFGKAALQTAKEGAAVGGVMSGIEVGGREALNPNDYNWKQNALDLGINVGAGAVLDPLASVLGPAIKSGAKNSIKGAIESNNKDLISRMLKDVGPIDKMPSPLDVGTGQNQLERLLSEAGRKQVVAPKLDIGYNPQVRGQQALDEYSSAYKQAQDLASQTKQANTNPLGLTDYQPNFTMRENNQLKLEAPKQENYTKVPSPDAPLEEKLAYWKDPEMARTDTDVRQIFKEMGKIESNIKQFNENLPKLREVEINRDPTIKSIYDKSKALLDESTQADDLWRAAKELQDQFKSPKDRPEWAYFSVDSKLRASDEFKAIPKRFVAKGENVNHGTDFAKAMDLAGFDNETDFIKHLQYIDDQLNVKTRKSLSKLGTKDSKATSKQLVEFEKQFENDLKEQFGISDMEKQLDELSSLATPYEPPTNPVQDMLFKKTVKNETPRKSVTEILYPNAQYGVDRPALNSARQEVASTTTTLDKPYESISQAPPTKEGGSLKKVQEMQSQVATMVEEKPEELLSVFSKGTDESKQFARRIADITSKNPVIKAIRKLRQGLASDKYNANYVEKHLLKQEKARLEKAISETTDKTELARLKSELGANKSYLKSTKDTGHLMMSFENVKAADSRATFASESFANDLTKIKGATLEEMANWQAAKRWEWLRANDKNVHFPKEDEAFFQKILANDKPAFRESEALFRKLQEQELEVIRKSGQKSQAEIDKLLEEPYYLSFKRDKSYKIARGNESGKELKGGSNLGDYKRSNTDNTTIKAFDEGDDVGSTREFIANPIDTIVGNIFSSRQAAARNDVAQQLRRLGQADDLGTFVTEINEKVFKANGGETNPKYLKGYDNGEPFYMDIHPEIRKMVADNDKIQGVDPLQIATTVMSRLKTTSPEFLLTSIPRDITQAMVNSEIRNPLKYGKELWKALTDEAYREVGDSAGVNFRNAYDPQSASQQATDSLQKEIRAKVLTDAQQEPMKATEKLSKLFDKLTYVQRTLGQVSDDLPRQIEANVVKQRWEKNIISKTKSEIEKVTEVMKSALTDDFVDGNVTQLQNQLESLQARLLNEQRGMEREMTHRGRDVMPYQRSGDSFIAKGAKKYINFANTTTQSKDKLMRSFARDPIGTSIKALTLTAPMTGLSMFMYDRLSQEDKDHFDSIPDYMKQQRYIIPLGNEEYVSIPKIQELAILSNLVDSQAGLISYDSALQYALKESTPAQLGNFTQAFVNDTPMTDSRIKKFKNTDHDPSKRTFEEFLQDVTIPSNAGGPILDMLTNRKKSFNGKPVSYNKEGTADDWTKQIYYDLLGGSDAANFAQYGVNQVGGDYGKYGSAILDMLYKPNLEKTKLDLQDLNPLQDFFYSNKGGSKDIFKEMFYDKNKLKK